MKKSMKNIDLIILILVPSYLFAQEIQLPTVVIESNRTLIPPKVKNAFMEKFGIGHLPIAWVNGSSIFKPALSDQNVNPGDNYILWYSFYTRTNTGWTLNADYSPDGKLIDSREYLKNFAPPHNILMALNKSDYRHWQIKKDHEIIKTLPSGSSIERCTLVLQQGKKKKTINFDKNGNMLGNKKEELASTGM